MPSVFSRYGGQLVREVLVRSLRGSLLIGGAMLMLSNTGAWQFMMSSFGAHDVRRAAAWATSAASPAVAVVTIDDDGFERYFGGVSPLDSTKLLPLLTAIQNGAPRAESVVVDLDLSPGPRDPGDKLAGFFTGPHARRWVLADPALQRADKSTVRSQWQSALCATGVRFAHPYLPSEFGYPVFTHQYRAALADVASGAPDGCAQRTRTPGVQGSETQTLQRTPAPLSASFLRDGATVAFQGDLKMVTDTLSALQPRTVVLGGSWGKSDVFLTPFGERSGAHLHAAAIAGRYAHVRLAPYWGQLLFAWVAVAAMSLTFGGLHRALVQATSPWSASHPGHAFLLKRLWPLFLSALSVLCLLAVAELSSFILARFGLWIPSASTAAVVGATMLFTWNWGLNDMTPQDGIGGAWQRAVVEPIRADWASLVRSLQRMRGDRLRDTAKPAFVSSVFSPIGESSVPSANAASRMSRPRAAVEACLAAASLLAQSVLPLMSLTYTVTKPL